MQVSAGFARPMPFRVPAGVAALLLAGAFGCSSPSPAPQVDAVTTSDPDGAPAPVESVAPVALDPRAAEVLAAAKKRLAADKALVGNRLGYERDLERQLRQRVDSQMQARLMPATMTPEALEDGLRKAAAEAALVLVSLTIEAPLAPVVVPAEHHGKGAYRYAPDQLYGAYALTARFGGADEAKVGGWLEALDDAKLPLPFVAKIERVGNDVVVRARCLVEFAVAPPRHVVAPLTIESLAAAAGVEAPPREAFGAELATLDALIAAYTKLMPEIDRTLVALGASHLEAERFRIYAQAADGVDAALGLGHDKR